MHSAIETLALARLYIVNPGTTSWPTGHNIEALGLAGQID
jgi:hypothetical protein